MRILSGTKADTFSFENNTLIWHYIFRNQGMKLRILFQDRNATGIYTYSGGHHYKA